MHGYEQKYTQIYMSLERELKLILDIHDAKKNENSALHILQLTFQKKLYFTYSLTPISITFEQVALDAPLFPLCDGPSQIPLSLITSRLLLDS